MQKKMALSFMLPIVVIYLILNHICYAYITERYEEKLMTSMEQSLQQTLSFLESYLQTMKYLSDMVSNSKDVQEVLGAETFTGNRPYDTQYREYYRLRNTFLSYEVSNPIYRIGLYVPDEIMYSQNNYFFYGNSRLYQRKDYQELEAAYARGKAYFGKDERKKRTNDKKNTVFLSRFAEIYSTDIMPVGIGTVSISIEEKEIQSVLKNTGISAEGLVYILDQNNQPLVVSDGQFFEKIKAEEEFPGTGEEVLWDRVDLAGKAYYMMRQKITGADWQMISLIPVEEYRSQQKFLQIFQMVMIAAIFLLVSGTAYFLSRYYVKRLTSLHNKMAELQNGDLNVVLPIHEGEDGDEIEMVYRNFNFMVGEVRRLLQEHFQLGKNVKMSELRALQAQINPHFLYNTLDLINWMAIDYGATEIENMVWNLSRFYRLSLNHGKNILTIREELEHVQVYVNIENVHVEQAIHYQASVPEELMDKACLNIILQPFVENSILHGMSEHPDIHQIAICITAEIDGEDVIFHIRDDGAGMDPQAIRQIEEDYMKPAKKGYGIRNINFRIKLCYGERYGISYDSVPGEGTTAHIRIPIMEVEEAEKKMT